MPRKFSNNKIKDAGKILSKPLNYTEAEINDAQDKLTYWRTIHSTPLNTFQTTLRRKIKQLNLVDCITAQRLKRVDSIIKKLNRFSNMKLSTMQDIAGIRAIVKDLNDVNILEENFLNSRMKHSTLSYNDYIENPKIDGYRGKHIIFEYCSENNEIDKLKVELQIRTKLQHIWATTVETIGIFLDQPLKSSIGPQNWLNYFSLVSAGFSIIEGTKIHEKYSHLTHKEIFTKIVEESLVLEISPKLRGFTVAADHIMNKNYKGKYNLIILNLDKRVVKVKNYTAKNYTQANIDYTQIEREIDKGANLQAVLVSTDSIGSLEKAFPSYFLDSQEYLQKLNEINALLKTL
ncbi:MULTISPECIES: RelA/SpoT domain-containing protein [unclassified Empedobacter]|uniref:RelA/SpoT domain-containing protein n=1 Tax=unclassified Empedobacter TaxID=2643773 RepID=UPI0025BA60C2|nr:MULTISPECIES: RelA/SpoT domain-containing protein [unclassified Empedobacter]